MIQEMRYSGVSANPSDYECADGSMSVSIGLVPEDGSFKPVMPPFEVIQLNDGEKVLFIHKTSSFEHFIIHNAEEGGLFSMDKTDAKRTNIGTVFDVANVNAVGNTLVILSASGINYYLWKDGSYKLLGDHIPDIEISFGLIGRPRLYSVSDESKSTFWIHLPERHDDLTKELSENNKTQQEIGYAEHPSMDRHCDSVFDRLGRCQEISGQHGAAVGRFGAQHPCGRRGLDIVFAQKRSGNGLCRL